jgi:hypothetical protein
MKRHHGAGALLQNGRGDALEVFLAILDDRELQGQPDLRRRQSDSRGARIVSRICSIKRWI